MNIRRLATLLSAVIALAVGVATPAFAYNYGDGYELATGHSGGHGGTCLLKIGTGGTSHVYFCQDGDLFHLWDLARDGKSVGVRWTTSNGHAGLCRFAGGAGKAGDCRYDFPESTRVSFSIGLCDATNSNPCTSWSTYTSKTGASSPFAVG